MPTSVSLLAQNNIVLQQARQAKCVFFQVSFFVDIYSQKRLNSSTGLKDSIQQLRFVSHKSSQDLKDSVHINQNAFPSKIIKHRTKQS